MKLLPIASVELHATCRVSDVWLAIEGRLIGDEEGGHNKNMHTRTLIEVQRDRGFN